MDKPLVNRSRISSIVVPVFFFVENGNCNMMILKAYTSVPTAVTRNVPAMPGGLHRCCGGWQMLAGGTAP